jgi:hypothetical protein
MDCALFTTGRVSAILLQGNCTNTSILIARKLNIGSAIRHLSLEIVEIIIITIIIIIIVVV